MYKVKKCQSCQMSMNGRKSVSSGGSVGGMGVSNFRTILVTGGGGYVGSHVIIELLTNNYAVVALDNLSNCYAKDNDRKPESLKRVEKITGKLLVFYKADIRDSEELDYIFKKVRKYCTFNPIFLIISPIVVQNRLRNTLRRT